MEVVFNRRRSQAMGLLPDTQNCGSACAGNAGNVFPVTAGERSRHASRHVHHARAVMHAGFANQRFHLKSAAGENVPGIPGACATCNFTYLVRGPWCVITGHFMMCLFIYMGPISQSSLWAQEWNRQTFLCWFINIDQLRGGGGAEFVQSQKISWWGMCQIATWSENLFT